MKRLEKSYQMMTQKMCWVDKTIYSNTKKAKEGFETGEKVSIGEQQYGKMVSTLSISISVDVGLGFSCC